MRFSIQEQVNSLEKYWYHSVAAITNELKRPEFRGRVFARLGSGEKEFGDNMYNQMPSFLLDEFVEELADAMIYRAALSFVESGEVLPEDADE